MAVVTPGEPPPVAPSPSATAWLDFDLPLVTVRTAFLDADLVVRSKIHRGMRFQWLPRAPDGERRLRQQMSVLDKLVVEEVVLEEGPGATWVKRFVEGPNAGTRFVGRFEALGDRVTRVTMDAYVGKNGFGDVVIGLSGGIDSALTAAGAVGALGAERVHGVSMPSRY